MESIVHYFKRITGLTPNKEQTDLLKILTDIKAKDAIISCGRGWGKTIIASCAALWWADIWSTAHKRPLNILLISRQERMYDHIDDFFFNNKTLKAKLQYPGLVREIPRKGFRFKKNRSQVMPVLPTSKRIRGYRADIVFVDEAADIPGKIIKIAVKCLYKNICKLVLISTPHVTTSLFVEMADNPGEDFILRSWPSDKLSWMLKTVKKSIALGITKAEYATEYLGRVPTKGERLFWPGSQVREACKYDEVLSEGGIREAGLDFGYSTGSTVMTIAEFVKGATELVLFQREWKHTPIEELYERIGKILEIYKVSLVKADSKPPEYKGWIEKATKIEIVYLDGRVHKVPQLGQLSRLFMKKQIRIPKKYVKLKLQLLRYKKGKKKNDDRVDSLALACYRRKDWNIKKKPAVIYDPFN